jgi:DNA-binding transcriptional MocR family regulator
MLRKGFAITPGSAFYANSQNLPCSHVRICYASQPPHVIEEAVQVLAALIREEIAAGSPPSYLPPYA